MRCDMQILYGSHLQYMKRLKNGAVILSYVQIWNLAPDITLEEKRNAHCKLGHIILEPKFQPSNDPYASF